ncbi:MAG: hypothetical protein WC384_07395 [Prolixibacteraceae bacterium]
MFLTSMAGLISIAQWALFLGIALIAFGFIEKKDKFIYGGQSVFILLGIFALAVLLTNDTNIPQIEGIVIPKEVKIIAFFKGVVYFLAFAVISLILKFFKVRYNYVGTFATIFFALMLFFMAFNILQSGN